VVFSFLDVFDTNKVELEELKAHYRRGGLGDGTLKQRLTGILEEFIGPIRRRREEYAKDPKHVMEICMKGSHKARERASQTLKEVREVMALIPYE
jgi:tryptophanyl-tRNA synthetase